MFAPLRWVLLAATAVLAQGTAEDYARSEIFSRQLANASKFSEVKVSPHWLSSGSAFWYRKDTSGGSQFMFVDAVKGERRPAFDHAKLAASLQARGLTKHNSNFPFTWIDTDGYVTRFRTGNKIWQFGGNGSLTPYAGDIREEKLQPLPFDLPSVSGEDATSITFINRGSTSLSVFWIDESLSPVAYGSLAPGEIRTINTYVGHVWRLASIAGKKVATYRANADDAQAIIEDNMPPAKLLAGWAGILGIKDNGVAEAAASNPTANRTNIKRQFPGFRARSSKVFVRNYNVFLRDGSSEIPITKDGSKENAYSGTNVYVSPNNKFAVVWQTQPEQEHLLTLVESSPKQQLQPKVQTMQYLKPGDRVQVDRPRMFDLDTKREVPTDAMLFTNPFDITNMGWNVDSSEYRFEFNLRGHQAQRVIGMNKDGIVRALIEETSKTFIDYSSKTYSRAIEGTDEIIWASERDGWNHLYFFDMKKGELINQITKGQWVMRSVESVDFKERQILFKGLGMRDNEDPYYAHLARVNFDGTGLQILTEGDGTHTWKFSPDKRYFTDTWSRVDMAPKSVLRDCQTGKQVTELEAGNLSSLSAVGWLPAERFEAVGRDGTTKIYGIIIKPSNFDPSKVYAVVEQIYAGPQDYFCPKAFSTLGRQHELAELGFVLVQIDGMGTNWRSKAFHDTAFKNLKDAGFPDRKLWMQAAAKTRPWMDISRVGIYGGSAGGQNAMAAVLFHGDFYKAAAADSGCHDNRMDKIWWNEAWMGWPVDKSYEDSSNVVHASKLTGALMLMVGELDTNVDPASTFQVANTLNKAQKDYDLLFFPGGGHGSGTGSLIGARRQRDFFVKHLLGVEPPQRNALKAPRMAGFSVDTNSTEAERMQTPMWATKLTTSRDISSRRIDMVEAIEHQTMDVEIIRQPENSR